MKYVVFETNGFTFPIIFPDIITHSQVQAVIREDTNELARAVSAGFFSVSRTVSSVIVDCFGNSESLELEPNQPRDSKLISALLGNAGSYAFDNNLKLFDM